MLMVMKTVLNSNCLMYIGKIKLFLFFSKIMLWMCECVFVSSISAVNYYNYKED